MLLNIWVALIFATLAGLGSFTLARNTKSSINRSFALFATIMALWVAANYIGANFKDHSFATYFIYADLSLGAWLGYTFWTFTRNLFAQAKEIQRKWFIDSVFIIIAGFFSLVSLSELVVNPHVQNGTVVIDYGPLYSVYSVAISFLVLAGVYNLISARRVARSLLRAQIVLMIWAGGVAALALIIANFIVPMITDAKAINVLAGNLSYFGLVLFITLVAYAIVRHRLFDIRLVVARSVAYVLVLSVLVTIYTGLSILVSLVLPVGENVGISERILYIVLAIFAAVLFPFLKKFFDKLTNRLFYRDAYDPQELLNTLNKVLVSTTNLTRLSDGITATLKASFKAEYCAVILIDPKTTAVSHIVGAAENKFSVADMKAIHSRALVTERHPLVIAADDLDYSESSLKRVLVKDDIAVLAQIGRKTPGGSEGLGHLLFGPKRSGNPYSSQDLRVIETIANELVLAFQNALRFEEIENFNATLQQKVDDATRKLRRTNEKLRQLDETKDDFISMASHQLRTPLTSVKGYVSMVIDGDAGDISPMQRKLLTQAFISSQRMVYLISDLLNVSRLRTGKFVIETVPVNLSAIIQDEVKQLVETAKGRNLELIYHKPEHFPSLMLDETKMRQVIMNFIDNAIYYTPSGGKIVVSLTERAQVVEFTVSDNGIGVPKSEQHHLFSKFYRADNAKRARPDGTGLGLFMAKKVIMAQGGSIVFKSQEGIGSTFGFTFAKAPIKSPASTER